MDILSYIDRYIKVKEAKYCSSTCFSELENIFVQTPIFLVEILCKTSMFSINLNTVNPNRKHTVIHTYTMQKLCATHLLRDLCIVTC